MPQRLTTSELVLCIAQAVSEEIPDVTEWLEDDEPCPESPAASR